MDDVIYWSLLMRYLAGECSPDEEAEVAAWVAAEPERQTYVASLRRIADLGIEDGRQYEPAAAWNAVRLKLGIRGGQQPGAIGHVAAGLTQSLRTRVAAINPIVRGRAARPLGAIVAMVLVGIGLAIRSRSSGRATWASTGQAYVTAAGQRSSVTLVDGTRMTLGPGSRARMGPREVELEGEAYFVVTHDAAHPFVVRAGAAVAKDVGTAFDVRAYPGDAAARIAVADGAVAVSASGPHRERSLPGAQVRAGDVATVARGEVTVEHGVDVTDLTGWTRGNLVFRNETLRAAAAEIGRWYDLDIRVTDTAIAARTVRASFADQPAELVLSSVSAAVGAQYRRRGRLVTISASALSPIR